MNQGDPRGIAGLANQGQVVVRSEPLTAGQRLGHLQVPQLVQGVRLCNDLVAGGEPELETGEEGATE
jgi:hypothetical protein